MNGEGKGIPGLLVLCGALVACIAFPASAGAVSFFRTDVAVGTHPTSVAVGNFNGGAPDLAVANEGSDSITILLGDGFGGFTAAAPVSAGVQPSSVVVGDFNGDPFTDLAVASVGDDNIAIKVGDGTGAFTAGGSVSTGTNSDPRAIATGDFNDDGKPDVVSANQGSSTVSVHLGDGMADLFADATPKDVSAGADPFDAVNPVAIAVIQLGGTVGSPDTDLDALVASPTSDQVLELLGDGTGEFPGAGTLYTSTGIPGSDPSAVAVGSLNPALNSEPDMLTANQGVDQVWPAFGRTDGTFFDFGGVEATGADPVALALGDLDGDGDEDGITANRTGETATVILSNGSGDVTADTSPAVGGAPSAVATGAFDADATDDVAVANYDSNSVSVLTSLPPGPPAAAPPAPGPSAADPRCAALRKKLKKAKKARNKAKVKKLRRKLRNLGCV
jgi:hypothetical protein